MNSRLRILATVFALCVAASSLSGCSFDPGEQTQFVGQECSNDEHCVTGAICVERRCQYEGTAQMPDAGADTANDTSPSDVPSSDVPPSDVPPDDDIVAVDVEMQDIAVQEDTMACTPTRTRCLNDTQVEYFCEDDGQFVGGGTTTCEDGLRCEDGECVPVDPSVCEFQDQPCNREGFSNGYYCADISGQDGQMRCLGICDNNAQDPDSTCPQQDTVCTFGEGNEGVCLSNCTLDEGCHTPGFGCLPSDGQPSEGICVPTNSDNKIGDRCDTDNFFDCEQGALCIDLQNGGRCEEACRAFTGGTGTDCSSGHCVPLTDTVGICQPDAGNLSEGDSCRRRQIYQTCDDDAVICAPGGGAQGPKCTRFCRLAEGDSDCTGSQTCFQYDQQRDDLGVCVDNAP
jgi:hypothetical protein